MSNRKVTKDVNGAVGNAVYEAVDREGGAR
jgi:hypothetical protein